MKSRLVSICARHVPAKFRTSKHCTGSIAVARRRMKRRKAKQSSSNTSHFVSRVFSFDQESFQRFTDISYKSGICLSNLIVLVSH